MRQKRKSKSSPKTPDPNRLVLQLDSSLCVVNEVISTPHTHQTDCLSESHELELDDVTKFLEKDRKKNIPMLDRMRSFASRRFLQPRSSKVGEDGYVEQVDTSSECDNVSIDCRGVDDLKRNVAAATAAVTQSKSVDCESEENIETPFDDFAPEEQCSVVAVKREETNVGDEDATAHVKGIEAELKREDANAVDAVTTNVKVAETELQYEFRNVNVSIQLKELIGISRISKKKPTSTTNDVAAVISYQGNSVDKNGIIFVDSTSLPLVFEDGKKSIGYANWPVNKELNEASTIHISRSVMRPIKGDSYVDQESSSNDGQEKGFEVDQGDARLPAISDTFGPEIVSLQVSLLQDEEIVPLGIATIIIPWDYQDAHVNVPVVKRSTGVAVKKKKMFAMRSSAYATFANDATTKYKMEECASLGIRLKVSPGKPDANQHASQVGQINNDNQHWQKLGAASSKLTLYQRLQLFTALRKQDEPRSKEASKEPSVKTGSQSSNSSSIATHEVTNTVQISVAQNIPPTPRSKGCLTGQGPSPIHSLKSQLSIVTEASSVPLFELLLDDAKKESHDHLSEISDSDSSCVTSSSGGTLTYSLYSAFSLNERKSTEMTENVLNFLSSPCDPSLFFRGVGSEEDKIIESYSSDDSDDSSCSGSTLSTSVYDEKESVNDDVNQVLSFDTPIYKLPLDESQTDLEEDDRDVEEIARLMTYDTPVRRLPDKAM